jgi:hypothetical protein
MAFWFGGGNDPFLAVKKQIDADMARNAQEVQRTFDAINAQVIKDAESAKKADEENKKAEEANWAKIQADIKAQQDKIAAQFQYQPQVRRGIFGEYLGTW